MKKIIALWLVLSGFIYAQNIVYLEYFFDTDPGFNNANSIPVTPADVIEINTNIDIDALAVGFHSLYIRAKDENGAWSFIHRKTFYKDKIPVDPDLKLVKMEYFFDTDPGAGRGIVVPLTANSIVEKSFTADLSGLDNGMHTLYFRVKDESNVWSFVHQKTFLKENIGSDVPKISAISYYFTKDDYKSETVTLNDFTAADSISRTFIADVSNLPENGTYMMHVFVSDEKGIRSIAYTHEVDLTVTDIDESSLLPKKYNLSQNFPNPFNPQTEIKFDIPKRSHVTLTVYNALGQKVADLVDKEYKPGYYKIHWNASKFSSGVYFYRIRSDNFVSTKKMMLLK